MFLKRKNYLLLLLTIAVAMLMLLTACGSQEASTALRMADPGWDSVRFHNEVLAYILKQGYDIDSETVTGSTPITWQGLMGNDIQIYMETWSDQIPTYAQDIADGKAIELSVNFNDNAQGLYVPTYMIKGDAERGIEPLTPDLVTVEDLKQYADVFADPDEEGMGRIYGAIASWEIDAILYKKYEAYGLDEMYTYFRPGSDAAMVAALVSAYESGQPWVGYYWEPTWVSGKYDLTILADRPYQGHEEDFKNGLTTFPANDVTVAVHPEMLDTHPEIVELLRKYQTSSSLTAEGLAYMNDNEASEKEAAIWFLQEHDELLTNWVTDANKLDKIQAALAKE